MLSSRRRHGSLGSSCDVDEDHAMGTMLLREDEDEDEDDGGRRSAHGRSSHELGHQQGAP